MNKTCYGIDFGTSNTSLSYNISHIVNIAQLEEEKTTIPSAMFFNMPDNRPLYGQQAINQFLDNEEGRFMRSLKRVLGTSLMQQGTVVNGQKMTFQNIIAGFLKYIKNKADTQLNKNVETVVMGRPVFFINDDQKANQRAENELRIIAESIGFKNIAFQYEPIAAAFTHETKINQEHLCLVIDIGGGTSDFTVIKLSPDRHKKLDRDHDILANTGTRIGGNDFDKSLSINFFMPFLGYQTLYGQKNLITPSLPYHNLSQWSHVNAVYTPKTLQMIKTIARQSHEPKKLNRFLKVLEYELGHTILAEVEKTKINLTQNKSYKTSLNFIEDDLSFVLSKKDLEDAIEHNIQEIIKCAQKCVQQAMIKDENISMVILTGGSTELPIFKSVVQSIWSRAVIYDSDKFSSVARGLSYDGIRRFS